jgi:hypothetical protein
VLASVAPSGFGADVSGEPVSAAVASFPVLASGVGFAVESSLLQAATVKAAKTTAAYRKEFICSSS